MAHVSFRALAKTGIAAAVQWSGATRPIAAIAGWHGAPPIITYHRVVVDFAVSARHTLPPLLIGHQMLERHLDWLVRRFHLVSLDEIARHLDGRRRGGRPVAAITFDDGYRDVYEHAFPLLRRKGIPAAIFVVTALVGTSDLQVHDRLYLLVARALPAWQSAPGRLLDLLAAAGGRRPPAPLTGDAGRDAAHVTKSLLDGLPRAEVLRVTRTLEAELGDAADGVAGLLPLSWEMISEMQRAGMTIGSHTRTHPRLTNEPLEQVMKEVVESRRELESRLGTRIEHFAYPAGQFDPDVVDVVAAAGYRFAYTTCQHRDPARPRLTIPRRVLWENACLNSYGHFSSAMMECKVAGAFDFGRCADPRHPSHRR